MSRIPDDDSIGQHISLADNVRADADVDAATLLFALSHDAVAGDSDGLVSIILREELLVAVSEPNTVTRTFLAFGDHNAVAANGDVLAGQK